MSFKGITIKTLIIVLIYITNVQAVQMRAIGLHKEQVEDYNACKLELESLERQKEAILRKQGGLNEKFEMAKRRLRELYCHLQDKSNDPYDIAVNDIVISERLKSYAAQRPSIFIAAGNIYSDYEDPNNALAQALEVLLRSLAGRDVLVVYDADSNASVLIERMVPKNQRLGISGTEEIWAPNSGLIYTIKNPHLRLNTILAFKHIYVSPDSILALGLLVEKNRSTNGRTYYSTSLHLKFGLHDWYRKLEYPQTRYGQWPEQYANRRRVVVEPDSPKIHRSVMSRLKKKWKEPPTPDAFNRPIEVAHQPQAKVPTTEERQTSEAESKESLEAFTIAQPPIDFGVFRGDFKNLGISYAGAEMSVGGPLELANEMPFTVLKKAPEFNLFDSYLLESFENFKQRDIDAPFVFAQSYSEKEKSIDQKLRDNCFQDFRKTNLYAGAVLFGSGRGGSYFEPLVKNSVKIVASSGLSVTTGGEAGFMEIANRAAKEIGIYSVGITLGKTTYFRHDYHSETIMADGYDQRIPFLLYKKALVIFAPGGTGTMTELATTLVKMASDNKFVPVAFLDVNYYGGLAAWFKSLNLPKEFANSIKFIESAEKMKELLP